MVSRAAALTAKNDSTTQTSRHGVAMGPNCNNDIDKQLTRKTHQLQRFVDLKGVARLLPTLDRWGI